VDVLFHAGLDPTLAGLNLTTERAISGLHACRTARAPGRIWAIAVDVESSKIALAASTFFLI